MASIAVSAANFVYAPQATGYNINDHHAKKGGDYYDAFDRKKWWDENSIFLYVGGNAGQDIKGTNNGLLYYTRLGYELQNLPWSKNEGTHSNIPEAIIEDLQNDKANWQLVLLQCGSDATRNGNYIGFYHKYRGILRILTYLKLGNFDFAGNTLGQGVWNLETAPVMYCTNAETNWKEERRDDKWETYWDHWRRSTTIFGPIQSPFGGLYEAATANGGKKSGNPWHGLVCFFDPSSVKVTLNPHLFSPSEIESAKVTAICGVRQGSGFSRYEQHRTAQGLQSAKRTVSSTYEFPNRYTGEAPFNAFGLGVSQFLTDPVDDNQTGCIGAGDSEYLIEPVGLRGQSGANWGNSFLDLNELTMNWAE